MLVKKSAWTGPPAPARHTPTGWDTSPASIALTVLLNTTPTYQSLQAQIRLKEVLTTKKEVNKAKNEGIKIVNGSNKGE